MTVSDFGHLSIGRLHPSFNQYGVRDYPNSAVRGAVRRMAPGGTDHLADLHSSNTGSFPLNLSIENIRIEHPALPQGEKET